MNAGLCPLCEAPAPVGAPCINDVCARRGYHAVPRIHVDSRPPDEAVDPFVGRRFGAFLVTASLGAGGMGSVYLGIDEQVGQQVAIKMLSTEGADATEAAQASLRKEATALARLSHPNIVRLVAFDTRTRPPYIAMEYVAGGRTLCAEMRDGLAPDDACRVLVQLSHALDTAHGQGIVHRDIKPANVMLQATADEPFFVRLVDFGLAKFTGDGHQTRMVAGTPQYMAPEQVCQGAIGPWTDFYAMGVLTFELLTGHRLFGDGPGLDIMRLKRSRDLSPLGVLGPDAIAPPMRAFLRGALARDPRARIATGADFREALDALIDAARAPSLPPAPLDTPQPETAPFVARGRRRSTRWYRGWAWGSAAVAAAVAIWALRAAELPGAPEIPGAPVPAMAPAVDAALVFAPLPLDAIESSGDLEPPDGSEPPDVIEPSPSDVNAEVAAPTGQRPADQPPAPARPATATRVTSKKKPLRAPRQRPSPARAEVRTPPERRPATPAATRPIQDAPLGGYWP